MSHLTNNTRRPTTVGEHEFAGCRSDLEAGTPNLSEHIQVPDGHPDRQ